MPANVQRRPTTWAGTRSGSAAMPKGPKLSMISPWMRPWYSMSERSDQHGLVRGLEGQHRVADDQQDGDRYRERRRHRHPGEPHPDHSTRDDEDPVLASTVRPAAEEEPGDHGA